MYNFTKDTITFVREDFYDSLEFLQQFDKDALLQMHFVNVMYDDFDNAIYRNDRRFHNITFSDRCELV